MIINYQLIAGKQNLLAIFFEIALVSEFYSITLDLVKVIQNHQVTKPCWLDLMNQLA